MHLDQAQALAAEFAEQGFHQGGLAGAAAAGEQGVVGGPAGDEATRVLQQFRLLPLDAQQLVQPSVRRKRDRLQRAAAPAVSKGLVCGHVRLELLDL